MTVGGPTITLSNGIKMPQVGLGTWQSKAEDVKRAVVEAIDIGYRLIDSATVYGNEEQIGEVIQEAIASGKIKREDLFITTKVWGNHLHPDNVINSVRDSLKKLKMDYVDLVLAHVPTAFTSDNKFDDTVKVEDTWRGFEQVYKEGLAKAIGVSNWHHDQIARVLKSGTVPVHNSQVELHLYFPQKAHVDFCKQHNISVTSYASLGSPGRVHFISATGLKIDWPVYPSELEDANVKELAKKYNKTPAQILLRYVMDRGIAIIPKSVTPSRIKENFQLFDFHLTPEEIQHLESTGHNHRLFLQPFMKGHHEDSFKSERN